MIDLESAMLTRQLVVFALVLQRLSSLLGDFCYEVQRLRNPRRLSAARRTRSMELHLRDAEFHIEGFTILESHIDIAVPSILHGRCPTPQSRSALHMKHSSRPISCRAASRPRDWHESNLMLDGDTQLRVHHDDVVALAIARSLPA